ncbi:hypothetical protein G9A89_004100 [Geosiphon pyriformis]|nr:hypothetical protein G9A89_004100 [Geosiphon pyriformis]
MKNAADLLRQKKVKPFKLTEICLERIKALDHKINAFVELESSEKILERAKNSEQRYLKGTHKGNLDGIPIAAKDIFCTKDLPTTCGSNMLNGFHSPYNATVIEFLCNAGAILLGKTNMDEFGMGSANIYSAKGPTLNPCSPFLKTPEITQIEEQRVAGGSSGGSAAAVASGMCFAALGSDTGGSVRLPASYCGVVGFKPSYGQCSRWGLIAYANSMDTVGILTRTVDDAKLIYEVISGHDPKDSTMLPTRIREANKFFTIKSSPDIHDVNDLTGIRVGVPQEYFVSELCDDVIEVWRQGIHHLRAHGATVVSVSCPNTKYALLAYYILAPAEASSNLARYDGVRYGHRSSKEKDYQDPFYVNTREEGFGEEVRRRIILGTYTLTAGSYNNYFLKAQKIRHMIRRDFDNVFLRPNILALFNDIGNDSANNSKVGNVHILLAPVATSTAPRMCEFPVSVGKDNDDNSSVVGLDPAEFYVHDVLTTPASLAGIYYLHNLQ